MSVRRRCISNPEVKRGCHAGRMLVSTLAHDSPSLLRSVITDTTYRRLAKLVNIDQPVLKCKRQ
jgi:hypothetical protein